MSFEELNRRVKNLYDTQPGTIVIMAFHRKTKENPDEEILVGREELYEHITLSDQVKEELPYSFDTYQSIIVDRMLSEEHPLIETVGDKYRLTEYGEMFLEKVNEIMTMPSF